MKLYLKLSLLLALLTSLTSCDLQNDPSSYLQNPKKLLVLVKQCQMNPPVTQVEAERCKEIFYASNQVAQVITKIQAGPEQFGEHILRTEMQYAVQMQKIADSQANSPLVKQTKIEAEQTLRQINLYLAVVGLASPE